MDESFDLVALQSLWWIQTFKAKLSTELKIIAKGMGVQFPILPVLAKEEKLLFVDLILKTTGGFDADAMTRVCWRRDNLSKATTLPHRISRYWSVRRESKDPVKAMKSDEELLDALNKELVPPWSRANDDGEVSAMEGIETEEDVAAATGDGEHLPVVATLTGWPEVPLPSHQSDGQKGSDDAKRMVGLRMQQSATVERLAE
jgi:hypothetical protein